MTATISVGPLQPSHRSSIEEIIRATGVFSENEIGVALELFDDSQRAEMGNRESEMGEGQNGAHFPFPISDFRLVGFDYEFIGAFDADQLVGYACFGATPSTDRTYDLYWIAVHPGVQRGGVGTALMSELECQLEQRSARLLVIETSSRDDYLPTRRFYHKRGYDESARLRDFYAPGDDRVVLTKRVCTQDPQGAARLPQSTTRI
ncbi:MAG: GNAT family N-acetyltransferase [Gemmatimonadaceae bacterium]